ncbi:MAG: hypothetical protein KGH73_03880, partial [Xanthomonadaceae bacterium]|nr:hypothetical protein [Xanthomonadaceae bacterium]
SSGGKVASSLMLVVHLPCIEVDRSDCDVPPPTTKLSGVRINLVIRTPESFVEYRSWLDSVNQGAPLPGVRFCYCDGSALSLLNKK